MTEEGARAEREEAERLLAEIRRLQNQIERAIIENQKLQAELESLQRISTICRRKKKSSK
jgi:regulator of replication initiation timing